MAKINDRGLRQKVFSAVKTFFRAAHAKKTFEPGKTYIPASGKVFDETELTALTDSALDFWLTAGRFARKFETDLAARLGARRLLLTNSGSSSNLLAIAALADPELGARRLKPGDEVITAAAGFPTTVAPIVQHGLVPVLVDVDIPTYNVSPQTVASAITPRTKAIMLAHTLGNPFAAREIAKLAAAKGLWLIEDCCDALGAESSGRLVSNFGDIATFSFYPAHHITMGEGGAVSSRDSRLIRVLESLRDWGRDCWCEPGSDDTCRRRFSWKLGDLPFGYDHKYVYSRLGYNLKATEMQAAVGLAQLDKLSGFLAARRKNFDALIRGLKRYEEFLILPKATPGTKPAWFGLPLTVHEKAPFDRRELVTFLESRRIGTRLLFAGNIARQPCFKSVRRRIVGDLENSDRIMRDTFWIGVYPGITPAMRDYVLAQFDSFFSAVAFAGNEIRAGRAARIARPKRARDAVRHVPKTTPAPRRPESRRGGLGGVRPPKPRLTAKQRT
jgi:CDP-6-deoxy-D-xylo-4-hexulose-3-dehydrase